MEIVLADADDGVRLTMLAGGGAASPEGTRPTSETVTPEDLPARVHELETAHRPRWVWAETARTYPPLLTAGVRVARCHDLRLSRAILRRALPDGGAHAGVPGPAAWDAPPTGHHEPTLLDGMTFTPEDVRTEHERQRSALAAAPEAGRLRLLLAAESAGALLAAEMAHDGLPFDLTEHDRVLTALLGPRPAPGARPAVLEDLAARLRELLGAPALNPDSPAELLRALRAAGLEVTSTRRWELRQIDHPAIGPLLEYKKLARLLAANGWAWAGEWVRARPDGLARFHPDYVAGGVVTGRWATSGGGALQLPRQVRPAVRADPGWRLVVADAAQLEPRVLAAMSRDTAMLTAAAGTDLYQGLVDQGIVDTRAHAKVAMLAALYGATTGEAAQLMPRLTRAYPRAVGLVEDAARTGERGGTVRTWLGRTSPEPSADWLAGQRRASSADAGAEDVAVVRRRSRDWGRFTRNFVVQGTAAEWALSWLAVLRTCLRAMADDDARPGPSSPHLVLFLHDEVVVHTPDHLAEQVAGAVRSAAAEAGRLLFGDAPADFPLDVAVVRSYDEA